MMNCNEDPAAELERLVSSGEVAERDKGRVKIWRWLTDEEAFARGIVQPEPRNPAQPQLPAPPELKLLAPPSSAPVERTPPVQAKRALTDDQLRKLREDRERPFGRPIRYPKGMGMP